MSITEHHDVRDEGHSIHVITLSIPCRQYSPTLGLGTMDDGREGDGVLFNVRGSAINARDAAKTSRQMIDFGMDTPRDYLCERTVEVCNLFGVQVKRLPELTVNMNLNLYRVIFTCSEVRCSELRDLGYKGKLVLVCDRNSAVSDSDFNQHSISHIIQFPYRLDDLVQFFRSLSQGHTITTQPKQLTTIDKILFLLQPHEHIPFIFWTKESLRFLSSLHLPKLSTSFSEFLEYASLEEVSEFYPSTSAYTSITVGRAGDAPDDVDFEYLINNKFIVSTLSHESVRIADNHVDPSLYVVLPVSLQSKSRINVLKDLPLV